MLYEVSEKGHILNPQEEWKYVPRVMHEVELDYYSNYWHYANCVDCVTYLLLDHLLVNAFCELLRKVKEYDRVLILQGQPIFLGKDHGREVDGNHDNIRLFL